MAVPTDPARLSTVERTSMTQQVLHELREAIIDGRLAQGESLREVALSQSLGTGRSAVREAIRQLIQEGLVEHEVHRGAYVRVMSLKDRLDVYFAREAIECGAVRRVIESPEAPDLTQLTAAIDAMRGVARGRERVSEQLIDADIHFHQAMVGARREPAPQPRARDAQPPRPGCCCATTRRTRGATTSTTTSCCSTRSSSGGPTRSTSSPSTCACRRG